MQILQIVFSVMFLIMGLIVGTRIGVRGVTVFGAIILLTWLLIKIPLKYHQDTAKLFYSLLNPFTSNLLVIVAMIVGILIVTIFLAERFFQSSIFMAMPEGVDRALGGAVLGAIGWLIVALIF